MLGRDPRPSQRHRVEPERVVDVLLAVISRPGYDLIVATAHARISVRPRKVPIRVLDVRRVRREQVGVAGPVAGGDEPRDALVEGGVRLADLGGAEGHARHPSRAR